MEMLIVTVGHFVGSGCKLEAAAIDEDGIQTG